MVLAYAMFGLSFAPVYAPRSWTEVLRAASTNAFALFGLLVLAVGLVVLIRTKAWAKGAGVIAMVAGAVLVVLVLRDIRVEIPSRRDIQQNYSVSN